MGVLLMVRGFSGGLGRAALAPAGGGRDELRGQPAGLSAEAGLVGVARRAAMDVVRIAWCRAGCGVRRRQSNADPGRAVKGHGSELVKRRLRTRLGARCPERATQASGRRAALLP